MHPHLLLLLFLGFPISILATPIPNHQNNINKPRGIGFSVPKKSSLIKPLEGTISSTGQKIVLIDMMNPDFVSKMRRISQKDGNVLFLNEKTGDAVRPNIGNGGIWENPVDMGNGRVWWSPQIPKYKKYIP